MRRLKDRAEEYRQNGGHRGGYVLFYGHELAGWSLELTAQNAQSWMPGTIAYDEAGNWYNAMGGNEYDGAERWDGPWGADD